MLAGWKIARVFRERLRTMRLASHHLAGAASFAAVGLFYERFSNWVARNLKKPLTTA